MGRAATKTSEPKTRTTTRTPRKPAPIAFGESFGLDVPTRYDTQTHDNLDLLLAGDALVTPMLFGMSQRTVWFCRLLAGVLLIGRSNSGYDIDLSQRNRLELEAVTGLLLMALAIRGTVSHHLFERGYLLVGGVMMLGNALMTELDKTER